MGMKNTIKEIIKYTGITIGGVVLGSGLFAQDKPTTVKPEIKKTFKISAVVNPNVQNVYRAETFVQGLPLNSDLMLRVEQNLIRAKVQTNPIRYKGISAGIAGEYIKLGSNGTYELGPTFSIQGKGGNKFGKIESQYYPKSKNIWTVGVGKIGKFGGDIIAKYNTNTKKILLVPAVSYDLTKNISIGMEAKYAGMKNNIKNVYSGLRIQKKF